jgi:histidyl-tRNA synthetase
VFEAWDTAGDYRAIFGGGRYDNLVGDVGGEPVGGVGFAVGDLIISLLLDNLGRLPKFEHTPAPVFFTLFDEKFFLPSLALAHQLRLEGLKVTSQLSADKLGKQFKYADRIGARIAIVLGPDEAANQQVSLKDLRTGEQSTVAQTALAESIRKLLEAS